MPISASSWIVLQSSMLHIMVCGYQQIDGYADAPRDMLREMSLWSGGIALFVINNFTS